MTDKTYIERLQQEDQERKLLHQMYLLEARMDENNQNEDTQVVPNVRDESQAVSDARNELQAIYHYFKSSSSPNRSVSEVLFEVQAIYQQLKMPRNRCRSLRLQARLAQILGDLDRAMDLLKHRAEIATEYG
ncbi:hypothetical protein [Gimesia panareensis]|uniref:hypothetical protein n=1 Tax=Gimesia panareensis TaxID=2527978 RepID=UPI0011A84DE5|nr:hypothetical protein [Gimesia panareensis]